MSEKTNKEYVLKKKDVANLWVFCVLLTVFLAGFLFGISIGADILNSLIVEIRGSHYAEGYEEGYAKGVKSVKVISVEKQIENVSKIIRENPTSVRNFLQEAVDIAVQKSPGMAIQVERYASEEVKKEMEKLRREAGVEKLLVKEKEITTLKEEKRILDQDFADLVGANEKLKKEIPALRAEIDQLKMKKADPVATESASVILTNESLTEDLLFKLFRESDNKNIWSFYVIKSHYIIADIPPGQFIVEVYPKGITRGSKRISINLKDRSLYAGKEANVVIKAK